MKKGFTREQKRNYLIWEIELDSSDCLHDFSMVKKDLNYNVMRKLIIPCSIEEKNIYHKNLYDYWEKLEDDDFIKFSGKIKAKVI